VEPAGEGAGVSASAQPKLVMGAVASSVTDLRQADPPGLLLRHVDPSGLSASRYARRLMAAALESDGVLLCAPSSLRPHGADQLAALALRAIPSSTRPAVIFADGSPLPGAGALTRALRRTAVTTVDGPHVTHCVQSRAHRGHYAARWGVAPARVAVTPASFTLGAAATAPARTDDGLVFAGGDAAWDYRTLIEALRERPVRAAMRRSSVAVVPLRADAAGAAGAETIVNAMATGKPVIASDAPGVREYVADGETGVLVPPGDPEALGRALDWVLAPANAPAVRRLTRQARDRAERDFSPRVYVERLLAVAREATSAWLEVRATSVS